MRERYGLKAALRGLGAGLLFAATGLTWFGAQAEPMQAPKSRVVLDLPEGYQASDLFSGFVNEETGASFVIMELPAKAYGSLAKGFSAEALGKKGITEVESGQLERTGDHIYMTGKQGSPAGPFAKHIMIFHDAQTTAMITGNIP